MTRFTSASVLLIALWAAAPAQAQMYHGSWLHRNDNDTTFITCWGDSLSETAFPPGCFGMGMMMYPDSLFCNFEYMPLDSLPFDHDSTFLYWRRFQIGQDPGDYNYLHCDMDAGHSMMGFGGQFYCGIDMDSTYWGPDHDGWEVTGVMCWDGSQWVNIPDATIQGSVISFTSKQLYSAIALVGKPAQPTAVDRVLPSASALALGQNYPNPFTGSTNIQMDLPRASFVTLEVYNAAGDRVATLASGVMQPGSYAVPWHAAGMPSGVYYAKLRANGQTMMKPMLLLR